MTREITTLGGGCFWCLEAVYDQLKGIEDVVSGYSGGRVSHPSYELVCTGTTGHAEVVQLTFDPDVVSFRDILQVFFTIHDPTTPNRQGADVGTQYRSTILYTSEEQKREAEAIVKEFNDSMAFGKPVVTTVEPLVHFYEAEGYHRKYYARNSYQPYCQITIPPKLNKLHKQFAGLLKSPGKDAM